MKNLSLLTLLAALCFSFNSCKKCNDCVKRCEICSVQGTPTSICSNAYQDEAAYQAAILQLEQGGATCTVANEEDQVCTSGLFFKLRHQEAVDSKEAEGFDCN